MSASANVQASPEERVDPVSAMVDVVVVSYNSASRLPRCVEPLRDRPELAVTVVDNASTDGSLDVLSRLPVRTIPRASNGGFSRGCNEGWRAGSAPFVLFLNPDARIDPASLDRLVRVLRADPTVGAAAPKLVHEDGSLVWSQRRFPRLWSGYAQALFLHRVPGLRWIDELIRDPRAYERPAEPDWVSGACILVRRSDLERIGGFDERFFLYREDIDLCRQLCARGLKVRFEPSAMALHEGGASAPEGRVIPLLAASRIRYARKYHGRLGAALERIGVALHAITHAIAGRGDLGVRLGHLRAVRTVVAPPRREGP